MLNFNKKNVVGVSITPELGLEVAQVDYATKTVLKYACSQLAYDSNQRDIADLDIFKETLLELLTDLEIPKGSDIVLTLPPALFKVVDYPASLQEEQVRNAIEEEILENPFFQNRDVAIGAAKLPNSTMQFNKYVYAVASKTTLIEIVLQIEELGYNVLAIDSSTNSTLNALIYNERLNVSHDVTWVMLQIENNCCRIISMLGKNYVDVIEERISIGEVLGDEENYSTVVSAVDPILRNIPSQYMFVVSKTNIISAEVLANKLLYNAPIVHQEANIFAKESFLQTMPGINSDTAKMISLDVIGAAINPELKHSLDIYMNLFNASLGDVYLSKQPPVVTIGDRKVELSLHNMIIASVTFALIIIIPVFAGIMFLQNLINENRMSSSKLDQQISKEERYLKENEDISTELFDEGDEIRLGLVHNKNIYTYFTIVGTEIPKKLWLTSLKLGEHVEIEGQADNLESIYSFFRNIKDYDPSFPIKLQKLGLASKSKMQTLSDNGDFDAETILSTMNADFYEFRISDTENGSSEPPTEESTGENPPKEGIK